MNFLEKDLTEYGKWLKFHNIEHSMFKKFKNEVERKMFWSEYDLTKKHQDLFNPFWIHAPDSSYFLDLDSYSLTIEKENGKLVSYGSEMERKVQVIRQTDMKVTTLLFCGSICYPETANWISDKTVQILGFSIDNNGNFIPTKWTVDLNNMLFSEDRTDNKFNKMPKSYMEQVRLKKIEFKK